MIRNRAKQQQNGTLDTSETKNNEPLDESLIKALDECSSELKGENSQKPKTVFSHIFGFEKQDLLSWDRFVTFLCQPCDPASLGTIRFIFGFFMIQDIIYERGLSVADSMWGEEDLCRFPFFNFLRPLPLQWMIIVYVIMFTGTVGIMLGFMMKISSILYLAAYWYIFFLEKSVWNNHSYLFGIIAFLLAISSANRFWSIDGLLDPKLNNCHVPRWNYILLRAQIFLVYFIAGLKKINFDWVFGYSMQDMSLHRMFNPFKLFLTDVQINHYIVHIGGLFIDLSVGFLLYFDLTRDFGLFISTHFNMMNLQLFDIGMFPYMMLVGQLVFCDMNWPRQFFMLIPSCLRIFTPEDTDFQTSDNCVYPKSCAKPEILCSDLQTVFPEKAPPTSPSRKHKLAALFTILFISWQIFLPFSHGITKGFNSWTNGLYGYSWDMMVHRWSVQHISIKYYDKDTGQSGYLSPLVWNYRNSRWASNANMMKQYAHCISDNLKKYNISNVAIYFDVWQSLNNRFFQRTVDPRVDIITAEWSPFINTQWMMPLLVDLSDWRNKFENILNEPSFSETESSINFVFVADFPGMRLENFVHQDLGNTSITVLAGEIVVELQEDGKNLTMGPEQSIQIPANSFHKVHTVSEQPSCYMYTYVNTTESALYQSYMEFEKDYNTTQSINDTLEKYHSDPNIEHYQEILMAKLDPNDEANVTIQERFRSYLLMKYYRLYRSFRLSSGALISLATGRSFEEFLNATYEWENSFSLEAQNEG